MAGPRPLLLALALSAVASTAWANEIVRCKAPGGAVTYQPGPCAGTEQESRPRIATSFPEPNRAESQRIFEREAALDRRLEARRDRELVEQQMREARAEREAERERLLLAAQAAAQQQYVVGYPIGYFHPPRRAAHPMPRHSGQAIFR